MTKSEKFMELMRRYSEYSDAVDYAAYVCHNEKPELIEELQKLKPSKKMIADQGFYSLEDLISHIEVQLSMTW
jgi:hypothetical protein